MSDNTPVLSIQMASNPTEKRFYCQILDPSAHRRRPGWPFGHRDRCLEGLRHVNVKMLLIDEAHNMLAASYAEQRALLNLIRFLSNHLEISVVCFGVTDAKEAISGDAQLARSFKEYACPVGRPTRNSSSSSSRSARFAVAPGVEIHASRPQTPSPDLRRHDRQYLRGPARNRRAAIRRARTSSTTRCCAGSKSPINAEKHYA